MLSDMWNFAEQSGRRGFCGHTCKQKISMHSEDTS